MNTPVKSNGNGKWQLAFWVISTVVCVVLAGVITSVVANDRLRASEDQRIEECIHGLEENVHRQYLDIVERLARIESKME